MMAMGADPLSRLRGELSDSADEVLVCRFVGDRLRGTLGIAVGALVLSLLLSARRSLNWEELRFEVSDEDAPPLLPTDSCRLRSTKLVRKSRSTRVVLDTAGTAVCCTWTSSGLRCRATLLTEKFAGGGLDGEAAREACLDVMSSSLGLR